MSEEKDDQKYGVYLLQNSITMETYIGSGIVKERLYNHQLHLKNGTHKNLLLQEAYNRNSNFEVVVVQTESREEAYDIEQAVLNEHIDNPLLLNICPDARFGHRRNWQHTEETKQLIREKALGRKHTEEAKAKMSKMRTGIPRPDVSEFFKGKTLTPEHIDKVRQALTGLKRSEESRLRIKEANTGRKFSEEARRNMGLAHLDQYEVDGVVYRGQQQIADAYGISVSTVIRRLASDDYPTWIKLD